jgi:hypothetical protein
MKTELPNDDSGVNIILEYLFTLVVMVILFSMMIMTIGNVMDTTDRIVLKEEFDIIANDIANRISAYSSEVYIINGSGTDDCTFVDDHVVYFDLPELVQGKQYQVSIDYDTDENQGTVKVTYEKNVNVYSTAYFTSKIPVNGTAPFYSQMGRYGIILDKSKSPPEIKVVNNA